VPTSRARRLTAAALVLALVLGGCSDDDDPPAAEATTTTVEGGCDDAVTPVDDVPDDVRAAMDEAGIGDVVGGGTAWFVAPDAPRWSSLLDGRSAKVALWVDAEDAPPMFVRRVDGEGMGTYEADPTTAGLPGPVTVTVTVPGAGCWLVATPGGGGAASILLAVE
jgi:hypothetical protein